MLDPPSHRSEIHMLLSAPPDQAQFPHACLAAHLNRALGRPNQPYCCLGLLDYLLAETEVYTAELRPSFDGKLDRSTKGGCVGSFDGNNRIA